MSTVIGPPLRPSLLDENRKGKQTIYVSEADIPKRKPVRYLQCQCSAAHTFGNVVAYIQNWLINLFPPDFFKTIHINSKLAHNQMRSTSKELLKKRTPMFIIRPRIDLDDDRFLKGTPIIERMYDIYNKTGGTNLEDFFIDRRKKVQIKYQLNRDIMYFDVTLVFESLIKQLNWAKYLQNSLRVNHPFMLETYLESYLSPELLKALSDVTDIPLIGKDGTTKDFMKYLNSNSIMPITYKLQGSSGTEEFYRYYPVHIETTLTNINVDDGNKVGHVSDRYTITFSVKAEFYDTGSYYLFSDRIKNISIISIDDDGSTIIPMFTDVLTEDDINLPLGWHLYTSPSCRLEDVNDEVNIETIFNKSIKECIKFHLDRGIPVFNFLNIRIRKQGKLLNENEDYIINLHNYTIKFIKGSTYYTYKIIVLINVDYVNNLVKDIYDLK